MSVDTRDDEHVSVWVMTNEHVKIRYKELLMRTTQTYRAYDSYYIRIVILLYSFHSICIIRFCDITMSVDTKEDRIFWRIVGMKDTIILYYSFPHNCIIRFCNIDMSVDEKYDSDRMDVWVKRTCHRACKWCERVSDANVWLVYRMKDPFLNKITILWISITLKSVMYYLLLIGVIKEYRRQWSMKYQTARFPVESSRKWSKVVENRLLRIFRESL
jgi:hypothetical protein